MHFVCYEAPRQWKNANQHQNLKTKWKRSVLIKLFWMIYQKDGPNMNSAIQQWENAIVPIAQNLKVKTHLYDMVFII